MNEKPAFHSFKDRVYYMKKAKTGGTANVKEPTYELAEKRSLLGFLYKYYGKKVSKRPRSLQLHRSGNENTVKN